MRVIVARLRMGLTQCGMQYTCMNPYERSDSKYPFLPNQLRKESRRQCQQSMQQTLLGQQD